MLRIFLSFLLSFTACCVALAAEPADAPQEIKHSFFIAGPSFTGIIDVEGAEAWNAGKAGARDGFILENGNALIAWADVVKEITRDGKTVFEYKRSAAC